MYIAYYGTESLEVSCNLAGVPMFFLEDSMSMGKGLLILYLCGWFSALVVAVLVCGASARCRQSFSALVRSLLLYIVPFATVRVVLDPLPRGRINMLFRFICYSMPMAFPGVFIEAPFYSKIFLIGTALIVTLIGAVVGAKGYCRHQVTK